MQTIVNAIDVIKPAAVPVAGLILIIIGFAYMAAKDPNKKSQVLSWATNVAIGFGLVYLGGSLVYTLGQVVVGF